MSLITREQYESEERLRLQVHATLSSETKGRAVEASPDLYRTEFQRDRDRILHCKAFRRLSHKTQVFLSPEGDHYRTRLTHTLEVAQISRSIARALRLNEDLAEAVALAHDLGHTPFGHIGEDALTECLHALGPEFPGAPRSFRHNFQSLRVVEHLEFGGKGLNLTWEVRDGIANHSGSLKASTMEGQIVAIADRIAYINHDIDDAIRGNVIDESDLPAHLTEVLGHRHDTRITTLVNALMDASDGASEITMTPLVWEAMLELRHWLFDNVYFSSVAKVEEPKAHGIVKSLFGHYMQNPEALPAEHRPVNPEDLPQAVVDYVSGMTDRFALRQFETIFMPRSWMF
ncbi:MAG: deoxyguanosinetriphosphate triphosphohydrolase [Actinobacteria bacterium]|nr:deoxyguanosinetriphosphate triphosphohydrolase [Actinomycetota bacterium]MCL5887874.1 deoxyguanosinetriphosphate triphosphohydrolase [Actinomycetota bacterium]